LSARRRSSASTRRCSPTWSRHAGDARRGRHDHTPLDRHEINQLLKNGAYGVLRDDDEAADAFTSADITQILARHTKKLVLGGRDGANGAMRRRRGGSRWHDAAAGGSGESRLGNFSRATFAVDEADDKTAPRDRDGNLLDINDPPTGRS
jgi:hypothetical protein